MAYSGMSYCTLTTSGGTVGPWDPLFSTHASTQQADRPPALPSRAVAHHTAPPPFWQFWVPSVVPSVPQLRIDVIWPVSSGRVITPVPSPAIWAVSHRKGQPETDQTLSQTIAQQAAVTSCELQHCDHLLVRACGVYDDGHDRHDRPRDDVGSRTGVTSSFIASPLSRWTWGLTDHRRSWSLFV